MVPSPDTPADLAAVAESLNDSTSAVEMLQAIVAVARDALEEIDHVGITLRPRKGPMSTDASTDETVLVLDQIQYDLDEGPCVSAARGPGTVVVAEHLRHHGDWHEFVQRAIPHGVRSVLAVRLFTHDGTVGVLNMYSVTSDTISAETRDTAELFATHAAYAYGHRRQVDDLHLALETRELIGNAVGIVMERYDLDRDRAFEYLVRTASTSEVKLRVLAAELVGGGPRSRSDPSIGRRRRV